MSVQYLGDINGELYQNQSAFSFSRFGSEPTEVSYLEYYFDKDNLHTIFEEMEDIKQELGLVKLNAFKEFLTNEKALNEFGVNEHDIEQFNDLALASKIYDTILNKGYCEFKVEI